MALPKVEIDTRAGLMTLTLENVTVAPKHEEAVCEWLRAVGKRMREDMEQRHESLLQDLTIMGVACLK